MSAYTLAPVPNIDMSRVNSLVRRKNPYWGPERLQEAQNEYLRFLQLCKTYPRQKIAAPPDIDEFWHAHMLDSVYYCRDCEHYFGYYLHHDPCLGDEVDMDGVSNTLTVYTATFNVNPPPAWMGLMTCANPGEGCGSIPAH